MKKPSIELYCTCGMHAKLTFRAGTTPAQIQRVASRFYAAGHTGAGHAPCDKETAERQQRASEAESTDPPLLADERPGWLLSLAQQADVIEPPPVEGWPI